MKIVFECSSCELRACDYRMRPRSDAAKKGEAIGCELTFVGAREHPKSRLWQWDMVVKK